MSSEVCVEVNLVVLVEVFELLEVGFELLLALMETWIESQQKMCAVGIVV